MSGFQPKFTKLFGHALMLAVLMLSFAFTIKKADDPIDKLIAALQKWSTINPQEKVYIHMDKPYYALGDTIWFKGYVMTGSRHQLSAVSGAVHVDLVNDRDSIIRSLKLPVSAGMVMGDLELGDGFTEGNYRLRAYTQWMRNAGEEYFFHKTFTVGSIISNNVITRSSYQYVTNNNKTELQGTLTFTDDKGSPLANTDILYRYFVNKKAAWRREGKTNAKGELLLTIDTDKNTELAGTYIRAYLQNADKRTIIRDFPVKASLSKTDVQFFPEGGQLVNGITSRVGFKALGVEGLGVKVTGKVTDNEGKEVAVINSGFAGMGSFVLRPQTGKIYSAKLVFEDGSNQTIALPKAADQGYVLSVIQTRKDSLLVRIGASAGMVSQTINVIAQTGGETVFASPITVQSQATSIWMAKKDFPSGIAQFTIFNANGDPLNERVAFIKSNDQLQLSVKSNKAEYKSREAIFLNIDALNGTKKPVAGNFSVSVIDESKLPSDERSENSIWANTLLTADIKGYVEKPNYYFLNDDDVTNAELDNLMLTQGYRRFVWKDIMTNMAATEAAKPKFEAEGLGFKVTGRVLTLGKKPLEGALVRMMSRVANVSLADTTDAEGKFKFDGIFLTDSIKFAIQARDQKNTDKVIIQLDTLPKLTLNKNPNLADVNTDINTTMKEYIAISKKQDEVYEKAGMFDKVQRLREVRIGATKSKPEALAPQGMFTIPEGTADFSMKLESPERAGTLLDAFRMRMPAGTRIQTAPNGTLVLQDLRGVKLNLIVNGRRITNDDEIYEELDGGIVPTDVARIDVVRTSQAQISRLGGPAIMIVTKAVSTRQQAYTPNIANISPKGFNRAREFYQPKYGRPGEASVMPDLRTTVYWNPYLKTGTDGKATIAFFNADGPGDYKVIVEGIDADGQLGRQVLRYKVSGGAGIASSTSTPMAKAAAGAPVMIATALDTMRQKLPIEKVYLHTDRPYYNIGDTLWFKGYLTDAEGRPSKQSGMLYVELDNDSTEAVRRVSLRVKDGMATGQIPLLTNIFREGGYTLRAYTNWMQNFGQDLIYSQRFYLGVPATDAWLVKSSAGIKREGDKDRLDVELKLNRANNKLSPLAMKKVEVKIYEGDRYLYREEMQTGVDGSLKLGKALKDKLDGRILRVQIKSLEADDKEKTVQVPLRINRSQKTDLQFLPEGGHLVAGLKSVVAFKAIGEDGKSTPVIGQVTDSKGNKVADFTTLNKGMGRFDITPVAGETYMAKIMQPAGIAQTYKLPKVNAAGTVLHIDNEESTDMVKISIAASAGVAANPALPADSGYNLIGTSSGGRIIYSGKAELNGAAVMVKKQDLPAGITRFSLLKGKTVLNERAVYIENKDQLNIKIATNKTAYAKRDSVALEVTVTDKTGVPVQGNFSLAVTDNTQVRPDSILNNGIATRLLLSAGLKGHIEDPGYYLDRKNRVALDNLLLTQGWTGYDWKDIFAQQAPKYKAEKDFVIAGKVVNLSNKPVPNSEVMLSSQKPNFLKTTQTDANGRYVFNKLPLTDSGSFFLQANGKNGKARSFGGITVEKFVPLPVPETFRDPVLPWNVNSDTVQLNYVKRVGQQKDANVQGLGTMLREVNIKNGKVIKNSANRAGPGRSDLSFDEADIKASSVLNLWELMRQKLPGLKVVEYHNMPTLKLNNFLVVIDIDGGGLPLQLASPPTVDDLIAELSMYQIATFAGMEVLYSRQFMAKYAFNGNVGPYKGTEILESEQKVIGSLPWDEPTDAWRYGGPFYAGASTTRPGYLEARANVLTNAAVDIAVIVITTKGGTGWQRGDAPANVTYRPLPVMQAQRFYSPRYKVDAKDAGIPDYRATVHWDPNVVTDVNGKAKLSFFTSDLPKDYTINFQGMTPNGELGSMVKKMGAGDKNPPVAVGEAPPAAKPVIDGSPSPGPSAPVTTNNDAEQIKPDPGTMSPVATAIDDLQKKLPMEKVYVHTDKAYYNLGDTLWFKAYIKDGENRPSKQSGLLYVEMDDDSTEAVRRMAIPVKDGVAWGEMKLSPKIFQEGGHTLRAYTNWMQNFGDDKFFRQRFYIGMPVRTAWLVKSEAGIKKVEDKNQLEVDIRLTYGDKRPIALKDLEVKIYEGKYYLHREKLRTGVDGSLKLNHILKDKVDGGNLRVQLTSLNEADKGKRLQVPLTIKRAGKTDLQFLPEGGQLVAGLKSTVGFKALSEDGRGMDLSADIFDSKGTKVTSISSLYNGMGTFELTSLANEVYTARVTKPLVAEKEFKLPAVKAVGTVLHISNPEQSGAIEVNIAGLTGVQGTEPFYLIATSGGKVRYSQTIDEQNSVLKVSKQLFPTGVARFTLMKGRQPLNDRMVFVDHRERLSFSIASNKKRYNKRDSVALDIVVKDPTGMPLKGNFSLAVTDNSMVRPDTVGNNNIGTSLLLGSELKGFVEQPGYYINRTDKNAWQALDNLLLTQGWNSYDWGDAFKPEKKPKYAAEKEFAVAGQVLGLTGKPVPNSSVLISSTKSNFAATTFTDAEGRFRETKVPRLDSGAFFIQAQNAKGKELTFGEVVVDKVIFPKVPESHRNTVMPWYVNSDTAQLNLVRRLAQKADMSNIKGVGTMLRNVEIKKAKVIKGSLNPYRGADLAFDEADILESEATSLWQLLKQKMPSLQIVGVIMLDQYHGVPVLKYNHYLINGGSPATFHPTSFAISGDVPVPDKRIGTSSAKDLRMDGSQLILWLPEVTKEAVLQAMMEIQIPMLKGMEIAYSTDYVTQNRNYYFASIELTSKGGVGWFRERQPNVAYYRPLPRFVPREFYSPRYKLNAPIKGEPDYRSTLYWEPNLITDVNGKARVSFFTSDLPTNYTINIQGTSGDGYIGGAVLKLPDLLKQL
ncbi:carboxypeptidase-like regulatory domain-containing protein [Mucilaginibacter myungsuensis]|uniref:Carboxypeptidase regulatory-like domain-containing protein n=1 Tax=Mucilaginibacter myungsuensis TaxID=649104 RepID=A0A929L6X4_9SPHI|nr:carboxypeptidase-like regulatory domain-containing protein [Mucilaginibacter myungsuensis]MBE9664306.1 carboxypeptidase regulatory-like domain-containing protein [Mucilaginibacter myungsuensis]MDN3597015.1 carboxypeptidase regulatory-like domain-containing protein [Mucilaginibacter myungsuensis]